MGEVKEENERLKMTLEQVEKNYQSLQLRFFDILERESSRKVWKIQLLPLMKWKKNLSLCHYVLEEVQRGLKRMNQLVTLANLKKMKIWMPALPLVYTPKACLQWSWYLI
ncbi:hypothetical protein SESBI_49488 [Sesbania bispinosa]|nr:hypothetical protein SESBI_49488 [Sesbania bispinosa]